jgi:hypothetical protein
MISFLRNGILSKGSQHSTQRAIQSLGEGDCTRPFQETNDADKKIITKDQLDTINNSNNYFSFLRPFWGTDQTTIYPAIDLQSNEIRLVHLLSSLTGEGTIQCKLSGAKLEPQLQYEALSYEWGPVLPECQILLNGHSFNIRQNLWNALRYLRNENEERVLWIDALCINQGDVAERNHQVAQMGRIYSCSTRCIAWVGTEDDPNTIGINSNIELAMNFIKDRQPDTNISWVEDLGPNDKMEHESFSRLCLRRYWSRLWIIQEILL